MNQPNEKRPAWIAKVRWLWFAIALFGIAGTPFAIIDAIQLVKSNHTLGFIVPIAFAIRFAMIWLFLKLWWGHRLKKSGA